MTHSPGENGHAHGDNGHADRILAIRRSTSYRQSHIDPDFMGRVELRPVRLQLELLKPELIMQEQGVQSTVVVPPHAPCVEDTLDSVVPAGSTSVTATSVAVPGPAFATTIV
jgi:hypothetical protein